MSGNGCWNILVNVVSKICMIWHVNMLEYNPSLLGGLNWGGVSVAWSQYPTGLHDLPQRRDLEILSRLRRHTICPIPRTKTNKYHSFIHYALAEDQ